MHFNLDRHPSPLGALFVVTDDRGALRALDFDDCGERMHRLLRRYHKDFTLSQATAPRSTLRALDDYFAGDPRALERVSIAMGGTGFQREVWNALRRIPSGTTASYAEVAARISRPRAVRAVGLANGANPIAIAIPCHRVIGASGALTGYGGGLARKRWLLAHEAEQRSCAPRPATLGPRRRRTHGNCNGAADQAN